MKKTSWGWTWKNKRCKKEDKAIADENKKCLQIEDVLGDNQLNTSIAILKKF